MIDRFAKYHPAVNFLYFTLVIGFSMALNHPLAQGISETTEKVVFLSHYSHVVTVKFYELV